MVQSSGKTTRDNKVMEFFGELGSFVEERWRGQSYNDDSFPHIAAEALATVAPSAHVDPWRIIRWLYTTTHLPAQHDVEGRFGNPPITLFDGPRFCIDVYYWLQGTTSVHQHSFCGAYQVLLGSSILTEYEFDEQHRINPHFLTGDLRSTRVELLEKDDIREILAGRRYIHALFHLDCPSATVVIRTKHSPTAMPQYNYHRPYLAIDPFFREAGMIKKAQATGLLLGMKHADADDLICEALSCSDFQTTYAILEVAYHHLRQDHLERVFGLSTSKDRFRELLNVARRRHGASVDLLLPVFEESIRQNSLVRRRVQITNNDHRFFLALLLNVYDRIQLLDLVRQRYPEQEPAQMVTEWLEELGNTRMAGSPEANVLGIENLDDRYLFVFQCLLEGKSGAEVKEAFEREFPADYIGNPGHTPEELYLTICDSILFKPIFREARAQTASTPAR